MPPFFRKSIDLSRAHVVGPVADLATLQRVRQADLSTVCDLVEFRLDALADRTGEALDAMGEMPLPVIATARCPEEGGMGSLDAEAREKLYLSALETASMLDVEVRSLAEMQRVRSAAKVRGVAVLASFHDFEKTPPLASLEAHLRKASELGADAAKLAVMLRSESDMDALLSLLDDPRDIPLSVMGMGEWGPESRKRAAASGSVLNYGYLVEPNAPGQISAGALKRHLAEEAPSS